MDKGKKNEDNIQPSLAKISVEGLILYNQDRLTKPLVPPYSGPHLVLSRASKHFTIQVGSRQQTVSIDRLKPAFQLAEIQPFRVRF
ncbi:hypothetical protein AVEN_126318-1 [Araneus ventricosus]|uniref:Uncharacterized protein n=1 Tax=Araneus ventricosus TaxID=182803 RepID=A0A4Y2FFM7_ARAVE|nr:hypothetical protein AVEN_126318-1 [Araneus ventricosus]